MRRRRLENCRADLADPRLRAHSIQDIAARWGFTHATDFSRAFRRAYGMPPRTTATPCRTPRDRR
ncbi:helix-turn-helix domain-containing protein [Streptosporangium sp. CA-135522]|uniref:helix-turn-helix domain-containing protein n=1 Tax=Streptosporangium sp. CA-135522 TaxID=3240072 RepID=UPI003D90C1C6